MTRLRGDAGQLYNQVSADSQWLSMFIWWSKIMQLLKTRVILKESVQKCMFNITVLPYTLLFCMCSRTWGLACCSTYRTTHLQNSMERPHYEKEKWSSQYNWSTRHYRCAGPAWWQSDPMRSHHGVLHRHVTFRPYTTEHLLNIHLTEHLLTLLDGLQDVLHGHEQRDHEQTEHLGYAVIWDTVRLNGLSITSFL